MLRRFIIVSLLLSTLTANAQLKWNSAYQRYIDQYKDIAIREMERWKIPASITLAQGLLESGAGMSELTRRSNNHFGIKCHGWTGRKSYHDDDHRGECFRAYDSAFDSFEDHSRFLASGQRYRGLFNLGTRDYKGWARGLKAAGYATSPTYANKLIEIIELYNLHQYDTGKYDKFIAKHTATTTNVSANLHIIKQYNDNYYVIARRGDTYRSLGREMHISYRRLAKYNERDRNDVLEEGEVVWLKKKRTKAPKSEKGTVYFVRPGDSMYSISQTYGIRVKNLYKINRLSPDYEIRVGDGLRLR